MKTAIGQLYKFLVQRQWPAHAAGPGLRQYDALWRWSVTDLRRLLAKHLGLLRPAVAHAAQRGAGRNVMPGAQWFPGAQVNYAQQVFRHVEPADAAGLPAIVSRNERGAHRTMSWPELRRQVASLALHLREQGVQPGDRVAAYLPNTPEAMVAFLAWPAWARCGASAPPTWARRRCWTASARSNRRC
jgi:acetoacetyl-CoA synthetase